MPKSRLLTGVAARVIRNLLVATPDRRQFVDSMWIELKRFGAPSVLSTPLSRIRGIEEINVRGPVVRHGTLVLSALCALMECERIFEFGASDGETAWLLAHNLPSARVYIFDSEPSLPESRMPSRGTNEERRIVMLRGDSDTFDFSPYSGGVDLVHIDGSRRHLSIQSDTEAAFGLLSELGAIVWYGYAYYLDVYEYLNAIAPQLDRPIFHILGTRLALYSRWDIVIAR